MVDANHSARNPAEAGARIAAIDVGSNSIRLVVAEVLTTGGYRVLDEERENTRLAAAESRISETRTKAMSNVAAVAEDAAAAIAERLTGVKPSADAVKKAVAGAIGG